ncbi:MAG TPA: ParB N-terminal domain-containing protein, partial [Thermoanaerobaculia bacterium]|nr:ParB N-terminal domain-containing protein [Thermoanaerobaculia bacterium]
MTRKQALGRGLSALLPGKDDVPRGTSAREVEIERLLPSRFQPRRHFGEERLAELAASIREQGVVQPIVVVPRGEKFE